MSRLEEIKKNVFYSSEDTVELNSEDHEWLMNRIEELESKNKSKGNGFDISIKCNKCGSEDWTVDAETEEFDRYHGTVSVICNDCGNDEEIK